MLGQLFEQQRQILNTFLDRIDLRQAERIYEKLLACQGVVILSGVGKSGHIAEKISTTLISTGTRSLFLSPANALHGDLGFVTSQDLFLALSKSGGSQELLDLLPHVKRRGAFTIAIVSQADSRLARAADITIVLPVERELCPFDLAPTTSCVAQLIFGDCLAMALMQAKNFTMSDFAANHPAGLLGRKINFKVIDLMLKGSELPICRPTDRLIDMIHELSGKRCGCLLVIDEEQHLQGIFTDGDLRRAIQTKGPEALQMFISTFMTQSPKTIGGDYLAVEAMKRMEEDPTRLVTVLPVLDGKKVVGLLRMHDILQAGL